MPPLTINYKESKTVPKAPQTTNKLFSKAFLLMIAIPASFKTLTGYNSVAFEIKKLTSPL
jgi:hypothetical protein